MFFLKLVVMVVIRHLALKKTLEQSYTSLHLHEPPSFPCPSPASKASWERRTPLISWLLDGFIKAGKFGSIHEQPRPDLALTSHLRERGGASRNFRPVDTRDRSPLLLLIILLLLLSASPSHGTREDPLERDRQRHSYTFGSLKVDDSSSACFLFALSRSRSDARKRDSEWIKPPVRQINTWGLSAVGRTDWSWTKFLSAGKFSVSSTW